MPKILREFKPNHYIYYHDEIVPEVEGYCVAFTDQQGRRYYFTNKLDEYLRFDESYSLESIMALPFIH